MIAINYKGFDRFQEPEYAKSVCCMCGKELDIEEVYNNETDPNDERDYCECCHDDMFVTV